MKTKHLPMLRQIPISIVSALLVSCSAPHVSRGDEATKVYSINYTPTSPWELIFPSPVGRVFYKDSFTALDIIRVTCDGKEVAPSTTTPVHRPDLRTEEIKEGQIIYRVSSEWLGCFDRIPSSKDGVKREYQLPYRAAEIEVEYRVRLPDGTTSSGMRIVFVMSGEKISTVIPSKKTQANARPEPE